MNKFDAHNNTWLFKLIITNLAKLILRDIDIQKNKKKLKRLLGYNPHTREAIDGFKRKDTQKKQRKSYKT